MDWILTIGEFLSENWDAIREGIQLVTTGVLALWAIWSQLVKRLRKGDK